MAKSANKALADNLKRLMQERGLSENKLGKMAGVSPNTIGNYCDADPLPTAKGKERSADLAKVEKLAEALGVSLLELISEAAPQPVAGPAQAAPMDARTLQVIEDLSDLPPARRSAFIDQIHQAAEEAREAAEHLARKRQPAMAASKGSTRGTMTIHYGDGNPHQGRLPLTTVPDPFTAEPGESERAWYDRLERDDAARR